MAKSQQWDKGNISIIKDWEKLRGWELQALVNKGYEPAIVEQLRRKGKITIYQMPAGDWASFAYGTISDGFLTREKATRWAYKKYMEYVKLLKEFPSGKIP